MKRFTQGYFKTAWADLTQDKRWWQPMLILSLVELIPIIGSFIMSGYLYDWAKEASWGLRRPFPRQTGDVAKRLKYGFFAFVVAIVWILPLSIVGSFFNAIPFVGQLLYLLCQVAIVIASVIAAVASLRALTYERISPGLQIGRMLKMAQQDAGGLARCFLINFVGMIIVVVVASIIIVPIIVGAGVSLGAGAGALDTYDYSYGYGASGYDYSAVRGMLTALLAAAPLLIVVFLVLNFVLTVISALYLRACGYWLGQFEPARWGRAEDPMPFERAGAANPYGVPYTGPQPGVGQPGAAQPNPQTAQQRTQDAELYEEAKRATDPESRAAEWEQEFAASQQAAAAAGTAGVAESALLAGEVAQGETTQAVDEAPTVIEGAAEVETPAVVEEAAAADETQAPMGWRTATAAAVVEESVAEEPVVETVGEINPEETVGGVDAGESVSATEDYSKAAMGWRSATIAAAGDEPVAATSVASAEPEGLTAADEAPADTPTGWRSASNAAN